MRRALGAAVALTLAALAGCGGGGGGEGATANDGTRLHRVDAAGFSLRLPDDWRAVRDAGALEGELDEFAEKNPALETYLRTVVENDVVEFFAFDPDAERGFATNVNVVRVPLEGTPSLDELADDVVAEAEKLPTLVGAVDHAREELAAGDALRIEYENEFRSEGGATTVATLQYVLVADEHSYVLTFSTLPAQADAYGDVFFAAARSFRVP